MSIKNKRFAGFWVCAAIAGAVIYPIMGPSRVAAQNPGLGGAKTSSSQPITTTNPPERKLVNYVVEKNEIVRDIVLSGELQAKNFLSLTVPRIQSNFGNTITYLAPEGSIVKKGERIIEFDDSSLLNSMADAERNLDQKKLQIQQKKADLESQRCDRLSSLAQAEARHKIANLYGKIDASILSENDYRRYQLDVEKTRLSLEKAQEELANFDRTYASQMTLVEIERSQSELNLKKIQSDMQLLKIDAPQDGILIYGDNWQSNRKFQEGDSTFPGMEIASLPDLDSMQVVGYVYDTEYSVLKPGMKCFVKFDALPEYRIGGTIESLTSVASRKGFASQKKLFQATVRLDRIDSSILKPGMTARVNVPLILTDEEVTAVPRAYVGVDSQGRNFVIKGTDPKKADTLFVKVGAVGDNLVEIANGLSVGDKLLPIQRMTEVSK